MKLLLGQATDKGRKALNQDFHGALLPAEPQLSLKGAVLAIADGIGSSKVSHEASAAAVRTFLDDYYCTSDTWSVHHAALQVLRAINSWLYTQTRNSEHRYEPDKGHVCTFSALVLKGTTAHLLHVGDTRIYRLHEHALEQLTLDHRLRLSDDETVLSRALGAAAALEVDYHSVPLQPGTTFLLASDGVHEHVDAATVLAIVAQHGDDLDTAAGALVTRALANGSQDNLTVQLLRVVTLGGSSASRLHESLERLPLPPLLQPGDSIDGLAILRVLHAGSRSHVYLAQEAQSGQRVALKVPSTELAEDQAALERLLLEEWIARRIDNVHVVKAAMLAGPRRFLYTVTEYVEGCSLAAWLRENPQPGLERTRELVAQVARGLMAFHRRDMLHQDLRPENIMIDSAGTARIIDFGSTQVAGIEESGLAMRQPGLLGTALYAAPEYFIGDAGSWRSDLYSLGVLAYFMLTGRFPYGNQVARTRSLAAQRTLQYQPLADEHSDIPLWVDYAIRKAVQPDPLRRQDSLSEFLHDLQQPAADFTPQQRSLLERNPLAFWQGATFVLGVVVLVLIYRLLG